MLCRKHTFEQLNQWIRDARENSSRTTEMVLVGTHLDSSNEREVSIQDAEDWAQAEGIQLWFEVSSLNGDNVDSTFEMIAHRLLQKRATVQ